MVQRSHATVEVASLLAFLGYLFQQEALEDLGLRTLIVMNTIDSEWDRFTSPDDPTTDGIVPGGSQYYPNVPPERNLQVLDGDSHVSAAKSEKTVPAVRTMFNRVFAVPRRTD